MPIIVSTPLTPGTGLDLCAIWFNSAADLADLCSFVYAGDALSTTTGVRSEVRQLANRRRVVTRGGRSYEAFSLTLLDCDATQVLWLREHVGQLLCVRDHVGSKFYGIFSEVPRDVSTFPRSDAYASDVKLTFDEVDYSEAV